MLPKNRRPTHPGEILRLDVIEPMGLTQTEFAEKLGISYPRLNEIINGKRGITPDTALRLGAFLDSEPEGWLNLQQAVDLWDAANSKETQRELRRIEKVRQTA